MVGAQFGDEAKGKIADYLAGDARWVVRTGGGPNAGHTIHLAQGSVVLHQVSVGVLRPKVHGVSGPGMVLQPMQLDEEIRNLEARGLLRGEVMLSERAHVLLPVHERQDAWEESVRSRDGGTQGLGTTLRGIGPAYADRYGRWGLRMADLVRPEPLRSRLALLYATKERIPDLPPLDVLYRQLAEVGERLAPFIRATEPPIWEAIARGQNVILEGAQSALLDIDFGTYPYVTSSHPTSAGALVGSGVPPQELDEVLGVAKVYATRVGAGPFPTEAAGEKGEYLRRVGGERGATTGRPRRTGWLDLVLLRYVTRLNGLTALALTKADVLGGLDEIPVCVAYRTPSGDTLTNYPPAVSEELGQVEPVYRRFEAWPEISGQLAERLRREGARALPRPLRDFLRFIESETGVPVAYLSYGARRESTLALTARPIPRSSGRRRTARGRGTSGARKRR